jgi:hypothetical protein
MWENGDKLIILLECAANIKYAIHGITNEGWCVTIAFK